MQRRHRSVISGLIGSLLTVALIAAAPPTTASAATIDSTGPLTSVAVSTDLNCAVNHASDTHSEWYGTTACGTFLAVNGVLYGPADVPAGSGAGPRTAWTPVSQTPLTGTGTVADPYTVVTVVAAGDTGVTLTQTDHYVVGVEMYSTSATVSNGSGTAQVGQLYTAGDCYLGNSDYGYGSIVGTSPSCTTSTDPGARIERLVPRTPGNTYYEAGYSQVWAAVGTQGPLSNDCRCSERIDNGIAIAWPVDIAPGANATFAWSTAFSPAGVVPLMTQASADQPTTFVSGANGYTITVANLNGWAVAVDAVTVTLPEGFSYTPLSTTGATTADPTVVGRTLTFTGPFTVPQTGSIDFHFGVVVSAVPGTYTLDVAADSGEAGIEPAVQAAPVAVLAAQDLALTKTVSAPEVVAGGAPLSFTLAVANNGPDAVDGAVVSDPLPAGLTYVADGSSPACTVDAGTVSCVAGRIAPGATEEFVVNAAASTDAATGPRTNTATVSAPGVDDRSPDNDVSSVDFAVVASTDGAGGGTPTPTGGATDPAASGSTTAAAQPTRTLPLTGADVAMLGGAAVILLGLGAGIVIVVRRRRA